MSKKMERAELTAHYSEAVSDLGSLLKDFSESGVEKLVKRAMLLGYWIKTYVKYMRDEDRFSPESVFKLKRGAIIRVEFGYRVGRELGGRHYAVVIDANNSLHGNTVTVVPLGSLKECSKDDAYNAVLEDGVYGPVEKKLDALIEDAKRGLKEAMDMDEKISSASPEEKPILKAIQRQKADSTKMRIDQAKAWIEEISHLKEGSVAMVSQLTTISKMRISQPLKKTHPLYGARLTARDLDKIDERLLALYLPNKKK